MPWAAYAALRKGREPRAVGEPQAAVRCEPRRAKQRKRHDNSGMQDKNKTLADASAQLASSVGYVSRQMWRRNDLEEVDEIILDLLCEALQRIGHSYRPKEGYTAKQALQKAPTHIQELVATLETLAKPEGPTPGPSLQVSQ